MRRKGQPAERWIETRSIPPDPGWSVSGVPFRRTTLGGTIDIATTFAAEGDRGMTVGHFPFQARAGCRLQFSVLGGHGVIAVVDEKRLPPRRIKSIPEFKQKLDKGEFGPIIHRIIGGHWSDHSIAVTWDLSEYEGKSLRLYVVDAETNHYGQIGISEIRILEKPGG